MVWLTPTSLEQRLGISAVKVNRLLKDMGLQVSNPKPAKGEPSYLPTEKGQKYSQMTAATGGNGDMTTCQHLKWSERVLGLFDAWCAIGYLKKLLLDVRMKSGCFMMGVLPGSMHVALDYGYI